MSYIGYRENGTTMVGQLDGEGVLPLTEVSVFWSDPVAASAQCPVGPPRPLGELDLRVPVPESARVICVGLNYRDHAAEGRFSVPERPEYFARWTPALGVSGQPVRVPRDEPGLDWEAELAVVVGKSLHEAGPEEALAGVFGYAAFNDLSARRAQHRGTQWTLGKNVDGSGILGPIMPAAAVGDPARGWRVEARVNGAVVQSSSTDKLIFDVGTLLADLSGIMTLRPGDVLATGTPEGVGHRRNPPWFLHDGDVVMVRVEGLGEIVTPIAGHSPGNHETADVTSAGLASC